MFLNVTFLRLFTLCKHSPKSSFCSVEAEADDRQPQGHVTFALANNAQFYEKSSNLGLSLSTTTNGSSTDLLFQLSAPTHAGWGAVGIGDRMNHALMFIIYPSSDKHRASQLKNSYSQVRQN